MTMFGRRQRAERFDALVRPHVMAMYQFALRLLANEHDAEDLVQDVLTKLYGRQDDLERVKALRPWLFRVLYHAYVDLIRRQGRSPQTVYDEAVYDAQPENAEHAPEERCQQAELRSMLNRAITQLTQDERALIELHLVQGHTLHELAETFDKPLGTIKAKVHRAKAKLKKSLGEATLSSVQA